jgi:SAM-dependent methyltransferase
MQKADMVSSHHWFEPIADHLGSAYLRYSFTKGTAQECDYLERALSLTPGASILDVGCGPGRHAHELALRGYTVLGIDISETFVNLARSDAPAGATFERLDARDLAVTTRLHARFDAVICLCQGAFGLMTASDGSIDAAGQPVDANSTIFAGMASALRSGGMLALSAFSSHFVVNASALGNYDATFDVASGVTHERTEVRSPAGVAEEVDLWTACYTPRELRLLAAMHGLQVVSVSGVEPGAYGSDEPALTHPEFLLVARQM